MFLPVGIHASNTVSFCATFGLPCRNIGRILRVFALAVFSEYLSYY
jgi:hypothetical protein